MGVAVVAPFYITIIVAYLYINNNRNSCHHCHPHGAQRAVVRDRTLIRLMTYSPTRITARSIPGPHRGGPGLVVPADQ